ncbi:hypothetical protein [Burkholderia ambifaria]|uniref:hypothetical protein n=1 Tax=Burkholderia ambifaria TaxID=152480 RepID=UPI001B9AA244|nr:hypothetical protein [Burkholderia ambifaria]MBR8257568.1 hypothetical protein [Burkholderia ambifaria]
MEHELHRVARNARHAGEIAPNETFVSPCVFIEMKRSDMETDVNSNRQQMRELAGYSASPPSATLQLTCCDRATGSGHRRGDTRWLTNHLGCRHEELC